jgi:hypothetical protein
LLVGVVGEADAAELLDAPEELRWALRGVSRMMSAV